MWLISMYGELKGTPPSFFEKFEIFFLFLFMYAIDRLSIDLSIYAWMSSIPYAVNFLFDFYENLLLQNLSKFHCLIEGCHNRLLIESLKNEVSTLLCNDKLFKIFLSFSQNQFFGQGAELWHVRPPFNFVRSSWNFYHRYFEVFPRGRIGRFHFWRSHPDLEGSESQKTGFPENLLEFIF